MTNLSLDTRPSTSGTAEKAFSFISKGWREVRDSAGADLQLMRARANSFKNLADREFENFFNSAYAFSVSARYPVDSSIAELEFVKRIQPKLSEFRRAYSSPDFSRKVLEKWSPRPSIRIDLSANRSAIVSEKDETGGINELGSDRPRHWIRRIQLKERKTEEQEWEPIRLLKTRFKEFEQKSQSKDIFWNFKSKDFVENLKLTMVWFCVIFIEFMLFFWNHLSESQYRVFITVLDTMELFFNAREILGLFGSILET